MSAVVKSLIPARPVGKDPHLFSHIPFLERNNEEAFTTHYQEDFRAFSSKKVNPVTPPSPAHVDHKDLRHIEDYATEAARSYQHHAAQPISRTPRYTLLYTNFKMPTNTDGPDFLTTQCENFRPWPLQPPPTLVRPAVSVNRLQKMEKIPDSTQRASFPPHQCSPVVKSTIKHLEGFPTLKGDGCQRSFVSHYKNTFRGAEGRPAQPVEKHSSSVVMGNPEKIVERDTTHTASFSRPTVCSPPVVKEHLRLKLGDPSQVQWSSTSRDSFCNHKLENPVTRTSKDQNISSIPDGDTDAGRNRERMSVTTNRVAFSKANHSKRPVRVTGADLMTKSNVRFSPPAQTDLYYTTTVSEHFGKKEGQRPRPGVQPPSRILSGPEHGPNLSTTRADFLPLKIDEQRPGVSQPKSNIRFPVARQHFSTTHSDDYTAKPLSRRHPCCSQFLAHFVMQ